MLAGGRRSMSTNLPMSCPQWSLYSTQMPGPRMPFSSRAGRTWSGSWPSSPDHPAQHTQGTDVSSNEVLDAFLRIHLLTLLFLL